MEDLMTVADAAEEMNVSEQAIRQWVKRGKLPVAAVDQIGGQGRKVVLFNRCDVKAVEVGKPLDDFGPATAYSHQIDGMNERVGTLVANHKEELDALEAFADGWRRYAEDIRKEFALVAGEEFPSMCCYPENYKTDHECEGAE